MSTLLAQKYRKYLKEIPQCDFKKIDSLIEEFITEKGNKALIIKNCKKDGSSLYILGQEKKNRDDLIKQYIFEMCSDNIK